MVLSSVYWCAMTNEARFRGSKGPPMRVSMSHDVDLSNCGKGTIRKTLQKAEYQQAYRQVDQEYQLRCAEVPETAFTLSAFGLPEPEGVVWDRGSHTYLYLLLAGVAAIAVALFFYRRKRWHSAHEARRAPRPS